MYRTEKGERCITMGPFIDLNCVLVCLGQSNSGVAVKQNL